MRKPAILLAVIFAALLGAMAAMPLLEQAPALRSHNASGQFDAVRAKGRLAFILGDQRPHPADSASDDDVRGRLVTTLQQMGLKPVIRDQLACNELFKVRGVSCARVRNVIAILGPSAGKAILLNAHYDSVTMGPGASDDGIGVATILEAASILKDHRLRRPIILLFNEGEELGLIGARAFLADPLSRNVDSLINLEARGVRGPVNMFETSRPNGAAIDLFATSVSRPVANSLSTDVYRLMPNYTDVTSFAERGWLTLNLAPIGNETRYHSAGDDIAALDLATLQHMGDQTLALAEALARGTPRTVPENRIFMDLSGRALISLPMTAGVFLLALLLIAFAATAVRRGDLNRGAIVTVGTMIGSGLVAWLAVAVIGIARPGPFWRANHIWTHLAVYASVLTIGTALLTTIGREMSVRQLRSAFWLIFVGFGVVIGLFAPGGIAFFIFPPILVGAGVAAGRWRGPAEVIGSAAAILFFYLTWGAMLGLLEELLSGGPMWPFGPLATLLLLPCLIEAKSLIDRAGSRVAVTIAATFVLTAWAVAAAEPAYSADRQQRFVIQHVAGAGKSWWSIVNDGAPLPKAFGSGWRRDKLPFSDNKRWIEAAPADPLSKAPALQLVSWARNGDERTLVVRLSSNGNDEINIVAPEDSRIRSAGTAGFVRPIDENADDKYGIRCTGRSCDGTLLQLTTEQPRPIHFLIIGSRNALPKSAASLLSGRSAQARPQYAPDASIAFARVNL